MRHEAAGITTDAFPKLVAGRGGLRGQLPARAGDARDGVTVTVPLFVLNQVSEERAEWLVPGMLKDKIQALLKSLPQRPRSRCRCPKRARGWPSCSRVERWAQGRLIDVLLKQVRDETRWM
jgi:ATP-dependent helicase HrpA